MAQSILNSRAKAEDVVHDVFASLLDELLAQTEEYAG